MVAKHPQRNIVLAIAEQLAASATPETAVPFTNKLLQHLFETTLDEMCVPREISKELGELVRFPILLDVGDLPNKNRGASSPQSKKRTCTANYSLTSSTTCYSTARI